MLREQPLGSTMRRNDGANRPISIASDVKLPKIQ